MNIGSVSPALQAVQSNSDISTIKGAVNVAMLSNSISTNEAMGASMVQMMEQSVNPAIGGNIDLQI